MFKFIIISLVCLFVGLIAFQNIDPNIKNPIDDSSISEVDESKVSATIEGEVVIPGIYRLDKDGTLNDLINAAGGLLESADQDAINRDVLLSTQVYFYIPPISVFMNDCEPAIAEKININQATAEQLATLSFVSDALAAKIVEYREKNGPFKTIEQLKEVSGIGQATYEKIRDFVTLK